MIIMSGIDSSGKSTQIEMLQNFMKERGINYRVIWSRGGYTGGIELLKRIARMLIGKRHIPEPEDKPGHNEMFGNSIFATLWLVMAIIDLIRLYSLQIRIFNVLGIMVICDRYIEDTLIDFKMKFSHIDFEKWRLWKLLKKTAPESAYSFLIEIPVDESIRRSKYKNEPFPEDPNERILRNQHYQEIKLKGGWNHIIDGTLSKADIFNKIIRELPL